MTETTATANVVRSDAREKTRTERKKKKERRHRKKQILRPNSPAAYPSALPIRNQYYDRSDESTTKGTSDASTTTTTTSSKVGRNETSPSKSTDVATDRKNSDSAFLAFRVHYLIVHIAIMLADGLQGTHLYVLYEGYGYTVASLYSLGFLSGALTSPFIGPLVDKIGRKRSAVAYCALEVTINMMEQYNNFAGLVVSRVVGGITTNLLFTVFEGWLVTEHRKRGFAEEKLEIILRDSVVASNLSAIASGCAAHYCASLYGPTGPFSGAVACTFVALMLVATRWEENYGSDVQGVKSIRSYMGNAFTTIISDSKIFRIGIIQGLTEGALQTFVFLWSPSLRHFANRLSPDVARNSVGIDEDGEPAYGLIFGAFMACGALGGLIEPHVRRTFSSVLNDPTPAVPEKRRSSDKVVVCTDNVDHVGEHVSGSEDVSETSEITLSEDGSVSDGVSAPSSPTAPLRDFNRKLSQVSEKDESGDEEDSVCGEMEEEDKPVAVELLASICFVVCACLLSTPVLLHEDNPYAFGASLGAFLVYEFVVGLYMPCEGVLRSIYMPNDSICSLMTMLRVIVNVAVALGVISTNFIQFKTAFAACSGALFFAAVLQLSLVQKSEWNLLYTTVFGSSSSVRPSSGLSKELDDRSSSPPSLKPLSPESFSSSDSLSGSYHVSETRKNQ